MRQAHDAASLTAGDIRTMLDDGDEALANRMICYGNDLRGTRAYWLARRAELVDMIRMQGAPHIFFTLSAADLQWPDLHRHMPNETDVPADDDRAARRQRRLALNRNPHLAASYLDHRVRLFTKHCLHPLLDVKHFWYRYEWQDRGSGHIHGFLWLKDAPSSDEIDWDLLKDDNIIISDELEAKISTFITFWDRIITAWTPIPPTAENMALRGQHPCNVDSGHRHGTKQELGDLLTWVQRHTICTPGYCQVSRKVPGTSNMRPVCRFDYPLPCRASAGIRFDSKGGFTLSRGEMTPS